MSKQTWWGDYILNVRYLDGGRDYPELDCWGLPVAVFKRELGIILKDWSELRLADVFKSSRSFLEDAFTVDFKPVETGFEMPFDVAVIRRPIRIDGELKRGWWHNGVVTRPGFILHNDIGHGCIEEPFRDTAVASGSATLKPIDVRIYRHQGITTAAEAMRAVA